MSNSVGSTVRRYRLRAGLSQEKLAEAAGVDRNAVVLLENRDRATPEKFRLIIRALAHQLPLEYEAIKELAFTYSLPDELVNSVSRSRAIALFVPSVDRSGFWSNVVGAITRYAADLGILVNLFQHNELPERQLQGVRVLGETSIAGVILAPATGLERITPQLRDEHAEVFGNLLSRNVPIVFIDRRPTKPLGTSTDALDHLTIPYVGIDNRYASSLAVSKLIDAGHERIGALMGLQHVSTQMERYQGFRDTLEARGLSVDEHLVRFGVEVPEGFRERDRERNGIRHGYVNAKELLKLSDAVRPTAIFCSTYYMALEARRALRDLASEQSANKTDLSLIGFDDVESLNVEFPRIPRVNYPISELARIAVGKVVGLSQDVDDQSLTHDYIIRHSLGVE